MAEFRFYREAIYEHLLSRYNHNFLQKCPKYRKKSSRPAGLRRWQIAVTNVVDFSATLLSSRMGMQSRHVTKSNGVVVNAPVTNRVEACVRTATSNDAYIVWLDRTAIFRVKSSCLSHYHCFFPSQTILECFAIALCMHLGPIPLLVLLPANSLSSLQ